MQGGPVDLPENLFGGLDDLEKRMGDNPDSSGTAKNEAIDDASYNQAHMGLALPLLFRGFERMWFIKGLYKVCV